MLAAAPPAEPIDEVTIPEAAVLIHRGETAVRRLIAGGRVRAVRRLGRIYVNRADIDKLRAGEPVRPEAVAG